MDRGMAGESQAPVMLGLWGMDATKGRPGGPATSLTSASLTVTGTQNVSLCLSGGEHISTASSEGLRRALEEPGNLDPNCVSALVCLLIKRDLGLGSLSLLKI